MTKNAFSLRPFLGFALITLALWSSGCATASRRALEPVNQNKVSSAHAVVVTRQQEMLAEIQQSNVATTMGGGLIPALFDAAVNNSRTKKAEADVAAVRAALEDFEPSAELRNELLKIFPAGTAGGLALGEVQIKAFESIDALIELSTRSDKRPVMLLSPHYSLSPDFSMLTFSVDVTLHGTAPTFTPHANGGTIPPSKDVIYANNLVVYFSMPDATPSSDRATNAAVWAQDGGRRLKQVFQKAIAETVAMLAYDLRRPGTPENKLYAVEDIPGSTEYYSPIYGKCTIERNEQDRKWLRAPGGTLISQ
jgi:hypothetical protein